MTGSLDTGDILVTIDTGDNLTVNLQPPDQYAVSITAGDTYVVNLDLPTTVTSKQSDSYFKVADFAVTASFVSGSINSWDGILGKPTGLVSSSTQVNYQQIQNVPTGLVSSSQQVNTGSFTGNFFGTSSFSVTASSAKSITFTPPTASFAVTAAFAPAPSGVISSSTQVNYLQIQNTPSIIPTASYVQTASYATSVNGPVNSSQISVATNVSPIATIISSSIKSGIFDATEIIDPPIPVTQFSGVSVEYNAQRIGSTRSGILLASWVGSAISYTDVSNTDVGETDDLSFNFILVGDNILLRAYSAGTGVGDWTVQFLFKMFPKLL